MSVFGLYLPKAAINFHFFGMETSPVAGVQEVNSGLLILSQLSGGLRPRPHPCQGVVVPTSVTPSASVTPTTSVTHTLNDVFLPLLVQTMFK